MSRYLQLRDGQFNRVWAALVAAFDVDALGLFLRARLDRQIGRIVSPQKNLDVIVQAVIEAAEREGWLDELVAGALAWNPHPKLYAAAQELGLTAARAAERERLERLVHHHRPYVDLHVWLGRLGRIENQVCRIESPAGGGTGFLVGPSLVLTNYHVVEELVAGSAAPGDVVLRFDYKALPAPDGSGALVVAEGVPYRLAATWLVDHSPYSDQDLLNDDEGPAPPALDTLDYALLRVDGTPGEDVPGGDAPVPGAPTRGWVEVPEAAPPLAAGTPLFIVQHPRGDPMKLAFDEVQQVNANATRVRYGVNTEPGSSGAPGFDGDLRLAVLHHAGDPDYSRLARYNQGIPLAAIRRLWAERGVLAALP